MAKSYKAKKRKDNNRGMQGIAKVSRKGYGSVSIDGKEYYIAEKDLSGAFDGDTVLVAQIPSKDSRASARVLSVKERAFRTFVGRVAFVDVLRVVVPRDPKLKHDGFVMPDMPSPEGLREGDWVLAEIQRYPDRSYAMEVRILEKIADGSEQLPLEVIALENGLEIDFEESALKEAKALDLHVEDTLAQQSWRRDIRDRFLFTIDPSDAKDFDDAISIEKRDGRYYLGVHIADVAHFVAYNSALDRDSFERGNSTYLPGQVIPMLPFELSAELCSLKPHEDRLSFSVDIVLDDSAQVLSSDFYRSAINSNHRLSYTEALSIIDAHELPAKTNSDSGTEPSTTLDEKYDAKLVEAIGVLDELAQKLGKIRRMRGGLDFDIGETKIELDAKSKAIGLSLRASNRATSMIEEAMILANERVASYLHSRKVPSIYRIHEEPEEDSLESLYEVLEGFEYDIPSDSMSPTRAYQSIISQAEGRAEQHFISHLLLRTLKRASYDVEPRGHFGLASPYYTHFTSPIRRYADLVVHRILASVLEQSEESEHFSHFESDLQSICIDLGISELNSKIAEREAIDYKVAEYMKGHIGEVFSGIIVNVVHFGFFVTLENSAEGLVHVKTLPGGYWSFEPKKHQLISSDGSKKYGLGQKVTLRLISVNLEESSIDFEIVE